MKVLDTLTIIINLLKKDNKTHLSVKRLQRLLMFIYNELSKQGAIGDYDIVFSISFDSIEHVVLCNSNILDLDLDGDLIYLRENNISSISKKYELDENIERVIDKFIQGATD